MRNPWRMQDGPNNKINRNNFPMSFQYNGTFRYGKIYPVGLWRTIPGATYQIDPTLALNFMPTTFPIQTRQRAYVHFFYGRDRNFWSDYKDFVNGMKPDLVKPYLDTAITKPRTGSLLDYLGVPTTIVGSYANYEECEVTPSEISDGGLPLPWMFDSANTYLTAYNKNGESVGNMTVTVRSLGGFKNVVPNYASINYNTDLVSIKGINPTNSPNKLLGYRFIFDSPRSINSIRVPLAKSQIVSASIDTWLKNSKVSSFSGLPYVYEGDNLVKLSKDKYLGKDIFSIVLLDSEGNYIDSQDASIISNQGELQFDITADNVSQVIVTQNAQLKCIGLTPTEDSAQGSIVYTMYDPNEQSLLIYPTKLLVSFKENSGGLSAVRDIDDDNSPYWRSGGTTDLRSRIKLNAIPCRMYETIYNLYYRNPQNNPYILDGKPEYNKFIPSKDGGVDSNLYELRYRNWEDDFLTTAVQSPQQGIAPLVGLTDRGATVTLTNDDGSVTRYVTNLDENGNVTGIETTDSSEPMLTQALIDAVSYGISIEDLRNVNAMQKWLELNLRKGYQYKDIIEARWGISISYNELDLPEFIGGFTQEVGMQAVTQTANIDDTITGQLGWQAGRMYCAGEGRQITHYCEEEGYIMALLCVVPVPNYSQLLPKHWFTRDLLDSYQPEFNHIGFQPITYKEVCPIQAYQESSENVDVLEQTFGYQRPWYEYFNQVDEVHGQFRTTLKDYLINRVFNVKPELSESFLLVDPEQINDVFNVTEDDDKILGAINYRITAKLPISLYAQARLE